MRGLRLARQDALEKIFARYAAHAAWMREVGIYQWNDTKYLERFPLGYYEDMQKRTLLYALADEQSGAICGAAVLLAQDERWDGSLQKRPSQIGVAAARNRAVGFDHALPRKIIRARPHRPADLPRRAGRAQQICQLRIAGAGACRNLPDEGVDTLKKGWLFHKSSCSDAHNAFSALRR